MNSDMLVVLLSVILIVICLGNLYLHYELSQEVLRRQKSEEETEKFHQMYVNYADKYYELLYDVYNNNKTEEEMQC